MNTEISKEHSYVLSHVTILKFFVVWGILETLLYIITKGNKHKELIIHIVILCIITIYAYCYPDASEHIK